MAKVMRLIWRLDFSLSYNFLDKLGTVRKILGETIPNYWNTVADGPIQNSFFANYNNTDSGLSREMSVELQSLNGSLTWISGTDMTRVLQTEEFRNTNRIIQELSRTMDVREVRRIGARFYGMGNLPQGIGRPLQIFSRYIEKKIIEGVEAALGGNNDDLAIIFTGKTNDEVSYRVHIGPSSRNDFVTFFQRSGSERELEMLKMNDFSFDIDLFEFNTSFVERNLFRWATTTLEKAVGVVAVFEKLAI
jgi:hypothetical protein